jgi:hypothetical protein
MNNIRPLSNIELDAQILGLEREHEQPPSAPNGAELLSNVAAFLGRFIAYGGYASWGEAGVKKRPSAHRTGRPSSLSVLGLGECVRKWLQPIAASRQRTLLLAALEKNTHSRELTKEGAAYGFETISTGPYCRPN